MTPNDAVRQWVVVCCGEGCDHQGHQLLDRLKPVVGGTRDSVLVRSGCLRPCGRSPVVLVAGGAGVTVACSPGGEAEQQALETWVRAGGPGVAPMPPAIDACTFAVR